MSTTADALVIGGGPAGAATAARLAAEGLRVVLCERQAAARPQVCGEFISGVAAAELADLGAAPADLGAHPIVRTRIFVQRSEVTARLPFTGYGLSRARLDRRLLEVAARCGADIRAGVAVRTIARRRGVWSAHLGAGGRIESRALILATGKHDLRGHPRASRGVAPMVGFKMHFRLRPDQAAALGDGIELFLYDDGYAGLQPIEGGAANLCLVMAPGRVRGGPHAWPAALSYLHGAAPALAARLRDADPLWERPASIARVPYGYLCSDEEVTEGLYRVGDQAAVIPSLAGEGIAIALRTARLAADAVLRGQGAAHHAAAVRREVVGAMRWAGTLETAMRWRPLRTLGLGVAGLPGVLPFLARLTRLSAPRAGAL